MRRKIATLHCVFITGGIGGLAPSLSIGGGGGWEFFNLLKGFLLEAASDYDYDKDISSRLRGTYRL